MDYRQIQLDKSKSKTVTDYDNIPEQRGGYKQLIQPGDFAFRLPKNMETAWDQFATRIGEQEYQRVSVVFDEEHPLTIIKAPKQVVEANPAIIGEIVKVRVNNAERNRARKGDPQALVSDMYYLLFEGLGLNGSKPKENMDWIVALNAQGGKEFVAALAWTAHCNAKNVRYIDDGAGGTTEDPDKQKGCGTRYYQSQIPRDAAGLYSERFTCGGKLQIEGGTVDCGASLRCFPNLERFRLVSFAEGW